MSYAALALCFSIIAFAVAAAIASGATALLHAALARRIERLSAHRRASAYLWLRLAPTVFGMLFAALFFLPAFVLFEPRDSGEQITAAVIGATLLAAVPLLRGTRAAVSAWQSTRTRVAGWLDEAQPLRMRDAASWALPAYVVRAPFPVVAVVGVLRPFLVVSRAVLDACSGEEMAAILAHEASHVSRRDNLKRLLMLATPDLLAGTAAGRDLELKWQQASEEVADDGAGSRRSLDLAAALVKVARLSQGHPAPPAMMAAFCRGGDIAKRVTRLTAKRPPRRSNGYHGRWLTGLALATTVALALTAGALPKVHAITELVVALLQ